MLQSKGITIGRISWIWWELKHRLKQDRYALRFLVPADMLIHRNQQKQQLPAPTMSSIEKKKKRMENYKKYYFIDFWQSSG